MELKYTNLDRKIILAIKLNYVSLFFLLWKLSSIMNPITCFLMYAMIVGKIKSSITFSLLIQMEWIKATHIDKNTIFEKKIKIFNFKIILPNKLKLALRWYNFCCKASIEINIQL